VNRASVWPGRKDAPATDGRSRPRRTSVRFRLGLAVAVALSPILALGVLQAVVGYSQANQQRRGELTQAALRSASAARARIRVATVLLENVSPATMGIECAPHLTQLLDRSQGWENFIRFNAEGRVRCAAAAVHPGDLVAGQSWFRQLQRGDSVAVQSEAAGLYAPGPSLVAGMRITDASGAFAGALVAVLSVDSLRPDVSDASLAAGTEVALLDHNGRIAAATAGSTFAPPPPGWSKRALAPGGMMFTGRDPQGVERVHAIVPLLADDVFVELSAPSAGILTWARLNALSGVVLPLLAWLSAWAAVWTVADRVVIRWLHYLDRIAAIYARGRFSVRPVQAEGAPEEFRALAMTLDGMADAIVARDLSLRESLAQKDAMMREIHHRVKNNLQVITSLLNMQQRALADPAAREAMSDTRQRITALALIYRALYQSPDLRSVDVRQFLEELVAQLSVGEGGRPSSIRTDLEADDLEIDPDKLPPLALFAVEAITNARKHAFGPKGGAIHVRFKVTPTQISLDVIDDGKGVNAEASQAGVGRTLMNAFARQLRGEMTLSTAEGGGAHVRLIFPPPEPPASQPQPFQLSTLRGS
jgi:two-component sensor histidine kinase